MLMTFPATQTPVNGSAAITLPLSVTRTARSTTSLPSSVLRRLERTKTTGTCTSTSLLDPLFFRYALWCQIFHSCIDSCVSIRTASRLYRPRHSQLRHHCLYQSPYYPRHPNWRTQGQPERRHHDRIRRLGGQWVYHSVRQGQVALAQVQACCPWQELRGRIQGHSSSVSTILEGCYRILFGRLWFTFRTLPSF